MDVIDFISAERIKIYENHTDSQKRAIALHNHTLQLGSSLMAVTALLELSLRNCTNQCLIDDFGDVDWLLPGHTTLHLKRFERNTIKNAISHAQQATYAKLNSKEKSLLNVSAFPDGVPPGTSQMSVLKKRQELCDVSQGQVISQTTFAFWKRLYSSDYVNDLWDPSIKKVFPNKSLKRNDISNSLQVIHRTRNRVAHHEPVYGSRLEEAIQALEFIRGALGARRNGDDTSFKKFSSVHYLRLRMDYESFVEAWNTLT